MSELQTKSAVSSASEVVAGTKKWAVAHGEALEMLQALPDNSIDAVVCDPPYGLSKAPDPVEMLRHWLAGDDYKHRGGGFMGKEWDSFVPGPSIWRECLRVLKPGGHMLVFGGTRTYDLLVLAIRLAGFDIRDTIAYMYGSGFPKSMDVSKAIDKAAGAEREVVGPSARHVSGKPEQRTTGLVGSSTFAESVGMGSQITVPATPEAQQWAGWGTSLKPAHEPICVARKPLAEKTVAKNVLEHGTGALNIDATRISTDENLSGGAYAQNPTKREQMWGEEAGNSWKRGEAGEYVQPAGRWPSNVIMDEESAAALDEQTGTLGVAGNTAASMGGRAEPGDSMFGIGFEGPSVTYNDRGGASRFFYCSKTSKRERNEGMPEGEKNLHPTVKPLSLMRYLVRLVTPPGKIVLDPFCGSGSTGCAAVSEGMSFIGVDNDEESVSTSRARIAYWANPFVRASKNKGDKNVR